MVILGGWDAGRVFNDGGAYDPGRDRWRSLSLPGVPADLQRARLVFADGRIIVLDWAGTAMAYDAATGSGSGIAPPPISMVRVGHAVVWTGQELIVWGGGVPPPSGFYSVPTTDGAVYDPRADRWRPMSRRGAPGLYPGFSSVWTGRELLVWGGITKAFLPEPVPGAAYDPASDRWRPVATPGQPNIRGSHAALWTGREMLIVGGAQQSGPGPIAAAYDPSGDRWAALPDPPLPDVRQLGGGSVGYWTGREALVWAPGLRAGFSIDPASRTWRALPAPPVIDGWTGYATAWTGEEAIFWSGVDRPGNRARSHNEGVAFRRGT
jgi:hypothetical protein